MFIVHRLYIRHNGHVNIHTNVHFYNDVFKLDWIKIPITRELQKQVVTQQLSIVQIVGTIIHLAASRLIQYHYNGFVFSLNKKNWYVNNVKKPTYINSRGHDIGVDRNSS